MNDEIAETKFVGITDVKEDHSGMEYFYAVTTGGLVYKVWPEIGNSELMLNKETIYQASFA